MRIKVLAKFILRLYLELQFLIQFNGDDILSNENLPLFIQTVLYSNIFLDSLDLIQSYYIFVLKRYLNRIRL